MISKSKRFSKAISLIEDGKYFESKKIIDVLRQDLKRAYEKNLFDYVLNIFYKKFKGKNIPDIMPSGKQWPKISVVTPSYNQGCYVEETIQSVLGQNYPNLEYIFIDGGSTDETMDIVKKYEENFSYCISERDSGQSDALNKGFLKATGDILCWLNSDDQFQDGALISVALAFDSFPSDMIVGICDIYKNGEISVRHQTSCDDGELPLDDLLDLEKGWNAGQFFYQPEVFFTRALWDKAGGYVRQDCFYSMDYELWCRFAYGKAKVHVINRTLTKFRMHDLQKTSSIDGFKSELIKVRDQFVSERKIQTRESKRGNIDWSRKLRLLFINDNGFKYGAGIAHKRIIDSMYMAGHTVENMIVPDSSSEDYEEECNLFVANIKDYQPDLIIMGNLHAKNPSFPSFLNLLPTIAQVFWLTHDFWLFTGRCAYVGTCDQYLSGCTKSCPTPHEYPSLNKEFIAMEWDNKNKFLESNKNIAVISNSEWAKSYVSELVKYRNNSFTKVDSINLGVDINKYSVLDKVDCRKVLGVPLDDFVIVFSFSSLSEKRKGGDLLISTLNRFYQKNVSLLLIGNSDVSVDIPNKNIFKFGYLNNIEMINTIFSAGDVYIGPSTEETFGQVFIEAAACGTASIGFLGSGVEDAIKHGVTGLLVEPNSDSLLVAMEELYNNSDSLSRMNYYARFYVENEHSIEAIYRSFFQVFKRLNLLEIFNLPYKISYEKSVDDFELENQKGGFIPKEGISYLEGPYPPAYKSPFRWCFSGISKLLFKFNGTSSSLRITTRSPIFELLNIEVIFLGQRIGTINLVQSDMEFSQIFNIPSVEGWHEIELIPDRFKSQTDDESRSLSFILLDINLI